MVRGTRNNYSDAVSPSEAGKELRSNSEADKVAQEAGYDNAHDFKEQNKPSGKGSDWNMMHNKKTGEIFLRRLSDGKIVKTREFTK
ncbi:hypothetical protein [Ferruginibacter albus]|uniref:hypothetical protein n=1 Tax=Ferruginibacter albus TaxID=2875540 RepID=UPI001CC59631|nr:hypothetical protein [Ferruginibacter albus]UAY53252.1 hypothetical protein K9M53_06165 [Ferruginibacter albus]